MGWASAAQGQREPQELVRSELRLVRSEPEREQRALRRNPQEQALREPVRRMPGQEQVRAPQELAREFLVVRPVPGLVLALARDLEELARPAQWVLAWEPSVAGSAFPAQVRWVSP